MVIISSNNNNFNYRKSKTTKGRQKIEIKKLQDKSSLQVTFSKRRSGLFNKAMELSVLCGAEVGILVFSPNGKMFVIGHPDFDTVLNWHLNGESPPPEVAGSAPCVEEHNKQYEEAMGELEKEKKRGKAMEEERRAKIRNGGGFWWDESIIEEMGLEELEEYVKSLVKLRSTVASRINDMAMSQYLVSPATMAAAANKSCVVVDGGSSGGGCGGFDQFPQHFRM